MNLVIAVRACHFVCFVVLLFDCRVRSNVEFSLLTVFERGKVNCEFADSQLTHYPDRLVLMTCGRSGKLQTIIGQIEH